MRGSRRDGEGSGQGGGHGERRNVEAEGELFTCAEGLPQRREAE